MIQDGAGPSQWAHTVRSDEQRKLGCAGAVTLVLLAICLLLAARGPIFLALIVGVVAAVGVVITVAGFAETRNWEPFELNFPEWPLVLGSTSMVEVIRRSKKKVDDREIAVVFRLECEEAATYTVGTDTRTDTETVFSNSANVTGRMQSNVFRALVPLEIPTDAGCPTLDLRNNKITWKLSHGTDHLSTVSFDRNHEFEVSCVIDPAVSGSAPTPQDEI